jgi:hypothetical protein
MGKWFEKKQIIETRRENGVCRCSLDLETSSEIVDPVCVDAHTLLHTSLERSRLFANGLDEIGEKGAKTSWARTVDIHRDQ